MKKAGSAVTAMKSMNIEMTIDELKAENMSYESILNDEDERSFMERIATERLGYAYPNERRFVDPNKNNG